MICNTTTLFAEGVNPEMFNSRRNRPIERMTNQLPFKFVSLPPTANLNLRFETFSIGYALNIILRESQQLACFNCKMTCQKKQDHLFSWLLLISIMRTRDKGKLLNCFGDGLAAEVCLISKRKTFIYGVFRSGCTSWAQN
jgi:hypothetical protein